MLFIHYFICVIAPVVLIQNGSPVPGALAAINLLVHVWSSVWHIKIAGAPPSS